MVVQKLQLPAAVLMLMAAGANPGLFTTSQHPAAPPRTADVTAAGSGPLSGEFEVPLPSQIGSVTDLAIGPNGELILGGNTSAADFPTTPGAVDRKCGSALGCWPDGDDGFIMILSPEGDLLYSTFVGADGEDHSMLVAPAPDGSVWALLSRTRFYVQNQGVPLCNGRQPVLLRIKPGSPVYHDMLCVGGPGAEADVTDMAIAGDGTLWLFGEATTMQTVNAWQPVAAGGQDLFVARYIPGRDTPLFATFLGGTQTEWAETLALTPDGDAVVTGSTESEDFPRVRHAPALLRDTGFSQGYRSNAVIARLDGTGRWLDYSLEVGGTSWETGTSVAVDAAGNAYVAGYTGSADFPVTGTVGISPQSHGESDAILVGVDPVGRPMFAARFGGSGWDLATHLLIRGSGSLLVFGTTNSPEFCEPGGPPPSRDFPQPFVRQTDSLCTSLCCLPRNPFVPTRHLLAEAVLQSGPHVFIVGDAAERDSAGRWLAYRGHYLQKWNVGRADPEDVGRPLPADRR